MYSLDLNILTFFLVFYIYCFMGWCFESVYVSIKEKRWVNRGFMKGPWLPIYGSGAVIILFSTIPVMESPFLVYILSVVGATVLELITGIGMEKLFKIKYWDYSKCFMNYKGYICLKSSVTWGFMGMLATYVINEPVAKFIDSIDTRGEAVITAVVSVVFVADFVRSFRAAYNLKEIIMSNTKLMEDLGRIKLQITEAIDTGREQFAEAVDAGREQAAETKNAVVREIKSSIEKALSYTEMDDVLTEKFEELKNLNLEDHLNAWREKAEEAKNKIAAANKIKREIVKRNPGAKIKSKIKEKF